MFLLAQLPYPVIVLMVAAFFCVCILLILTVLIQKPAGGGLSGAFGSGAGSGQTAFGAKTGDALTIATIIMFSVFVLGAIGLNYVTRPIQGGPVTPAAASGGGGGAAPEGESAPAGGEGAKNQTPPGDQPETPPAEQPPAEEPPAQPK